MIQIKMEDKTKITEDVDLKLNLENVEPSETKLLAGTCKISIKKFDKEEAKKDFVPKAKVIESMSKEKSSYSNQVVVDMIKKLGEFDYEKHKPHDLDESKLEYRELCKHGPKAEYQGQWLIGTETRQGRGQNTWEDGSIYHGYWVNN